MTPHNVTNTPVIAYNWDEAVSKLGYSEEKDEDGHYLYTLCASMYASFKLVNVAPVIFVNVLDPNKHKKENVEATYPWRAWRLSSYHRHSAEHCPGQDRDRRYRPGG